MLEPPAEIAAPLGGPDRRNPVSPTGRGWFRRRSRPSQKGWSVGAKFVLILCVVTVAVVGVVGVALGGLNRAASHSVEHAQSLQVSQALADLHGTLDAVQRAAQEETTVATGAPRVDELNAQLRSGLVPALGMAITAMAVLDKEDRQFTEQLSRLTTDEATYLGVQDQVIQAARSGQLDKPAIRSGLAASSTQLLDGMGGVVEQMRTQESVRANAAQVRADSQDRATVASLLGGGLLAVITTFLVVLLLLRNLVPRIQDYSRFATEVAAGRPPGTLEPRGDDALTELGRALNDMVDKNAARAAHEETLRQFEELQTEFVDTLQVTATEDEAHDLVQRHIERFVPCSVATVLKRNNSANRLQAATMVDAGSELGVRLTGAEPRSCLAVRFARTHREGSGRPPLLGCAICADLGCPATCEPLLVGGEVIGSVVVTHDQLLTANTEARIRTTVVQAAPVLANLRNLALAEFRANNDSLTGLPNKRATDDTLKRMVAQANRSISMLAAIVLDLDHFKEINDRFGHASGDEVLAAVGAALQSCLRASDFAGRFGGEEFLILLPETDVNGAMQLGEKIRRTVAELAIPGVERAITASLGVAGLPEHAGNSDGLLREADRAMYAAKLGGRNKTLAATTPDARSLPAHDPRPAASPEPDTSMNPA